MQGKCGWDHDIRAATPEEREPLMPDHPELGPHCDYCDRSVAFIASFTRWHSSRSNRTGKLLKRPWLRQLELCTVHGAEWCRVYKLPLLEQGPLPIPTPLCPYCGRSAGIDRTMALLVDLGPGIHVAALKCSECKRDYSAQLTFVLRVDTEPSSTLPPRGWAATQQKPEQAV
jgi:hypothetical protein